MVPEEEQEDDDNGEEGGGSGGGGSNGGGGTSTKDSSATATAKTVHKTANYDEIIFQVICFYFDTHCSFGAMS